MNATKFPWETHVIYEPPPLPPRYGKSRIRNRYVLLVLGILALVTGALIAMNSSGFPQL